MDAHIQKVYVPMTETGFYILQMCIRDRIVERTKKIYTPVVGIHQKRYHQRKGDTARHCKQHVLECNLADLVKISVSCKKANIVIKANEAGIIRQCFIGK